MITNRRQCCHGYLASLLCTTGGSWRGSPTRTNLCAAYSGARHAGCSTCDPSSTITMSNTRRENNAWFIPRQLLATIVCIEHQHDIITILVIFGK